MKSRNLGIMLIAALLLVALVFAGAATAADTEVHVSDFQTGEGYYSTLSEALDATENDDAVIILDNDVTLDEYLYIQKTGKNVTIDGDNHKIILSKDFEQDDACHAIYISEDNLADENFVALKNVAIDFNGVGGDLFVENVKDTHPETKFTNVLLANIKTTVDGQTPVRSGLHLSGADVNAEDLQFKFTYGGKYENPHTLMQFLVSHIDLGTISEAKHGTNLHTNMLMCGAYGKYPAGSTNLDPKVFDVDGEVDATVEFTTVFDTTVKVWSAFAWNRVHEVSTWAELADLVDSFEISTLDEQVLTIGDTIKLAADFPAEGERMEIAIPKFVAFDSRDATTGTPHVITLPEGYNISVTTQLGLLGVLGPEYSSIIGDGFVVVDDGGIIDLDNSQLTYLSSGITFQNDAETNELSITVPDDGIFRIYPGTVGETGLEVSVPSGKTISLYGKNATVSVKTTADLNVDGELFLYAPVNEWANVKGTGTVSFFEVPTGGVPKNTGSVTLQFAPFVVGDDGQMAAGDLYEDGTVVDDPYSLLIAGDETWSLSADKKTLTIDNKAYTVKDRTTNADHYWSVASTGTINNARILDVDSTAKTLYYVDADLASSSAPYFKTLKEAVTAAEANPTENIVIKLKTDAVLDETLFVGNTQANLEIDGQGHKIAMLTYNEWPRQEFKFSDSDKHVIVFDMKDRKAGTTLSLKDVTIDFRNDYAKAQGYKTHKSYPGDILISNKGTNGKPTMSITDVTLANPPTFLDEATLRSVLHIDGANVVVENLKFGFSDIFGIIEGLELPYLDPITPSQFRTSEIDLSPSTGTTLQAKLTINDMPAGAFALYLNYGAENIAPVVIKTRDKEKLVPRQHILPLSAQTLDVYSGFGEGLYEVTSWDDLKKLTRSGKLQEGDVIKVLADIKSNGKGENIDIPAGVVIDPTVVIPIITRDIELTGSDSITVHDLPALASLIGLPGVDGPKNSITKGSGTIILAADFENIEEMEDFLYIPPQTKIKFGKPVDGKSTINVVLPTADKEQENTLTVFVNLMFPVFEGYKNTTITITDNVDGNGDNAAKLRIVDDPLFSSEENGGIKSLGVYGTVNLKVPVIEWPTYGVDGDGNGVLNIYENSSEIPVIDNVTVKYAPISRTGIGIIQKNGKKLSNLDVLYEHGTKWHLDNKNKQILIIGDDKFKLVSFMRLPSSWNLTGTQGTLTNAREMEAVFTSPWGTAVYFQYENGDVDEAIFAVGDSVEDMIPSIAKDGYTAYWNESTGKGNITDSTYVLNGEWVYPGEDELYFNEISNLNTVETKADGNGSVTFGNNNTTAINEEQSKVSHVVLESVDNVARNSEVVFTPETEAEILADIPITDAKKYTKTDIAVFDISATAIEDDPKFTVTINFATSNTARDSAPLTRFWHYLESTSEWELLDSTYDVSGSNVIYTVETDSFSPFAISVESLKEKAYPSSSSSGGNGGATIIQTETPTTAPTVNPTVNPTIVPSAKPTTQQTQKSPAPFAGLVLGLGAALVLARMRR